ncbi:MAG: hypothetical protein WAK55_16135, partial [Xanthobacteraceae bacterium]
RLFASSPIFNSASQRVARAQVTVYREKLRLRRALQAQERHLRLNHRNGRCGVDNFEPNRRDVTTLKLAIIGLAGAAILNH